MKLGLPAALSVSVSRMKKGHLISTSRHTEPQTSTRSGSRRAAFDRAGVRYKG